MKHTIITKFIGFVLAACTLVISIAAACAVALIGNLHLYTSSFDESKNVYLQDRAELLGKQVLSRYVAAEMGFCDETAISAAGLDYTDADLTEGLSLQAGSWSYRIFDSQGRILESAPNWMKENHEKTYELALEGNYPMDILETDLPNYDISGFQYRDFYYVDEQLHYLYYFASEEEYNVTVTMAEDALENYNGISESLLLRLFRMRYRVIVYLCVSLLLFAMATVYLCCAAGKTHRDSEPAPGGLNRVPLDLYLLFVVGAGYLLAYIAVWVLGEWFFISTGEYNYGALALVALLILAAAVAGIGFLFAVAAQVKMKGAYWFKHTALGFLFWKMWHGLRFLFRSISKLIGVLPVIWQWLLVGISMGFFPLLFVFLAFAADDAWLIPLFFSLLVDAAVLCYGGYAYGTVLSGARRMADGDLDTKIPVRFLRGAYRKCAEDLNELADVAILAARNQMKSERMKTELITNVSHDIKTPLTSIINYVDLLEKPHSPQQQQEYLEVLGRQSQRMKKLIEDLVEMSKATTGNMTVEITRMDAVETLNQALGEFSEKLTKSALTPVFHHPQEPVYMMADGRLTWRVLSNVLSNAVKYALPGTRLYIDLTQRDGKVEISLKNISREELNVSADELTERFVRGDASRNTEGSGLGLNIAQSLMELQKGKLQLLVDGDLFKVTLVFPGM